MTAARTPFAWLGQDGVLLEMAEPYWLAWECAAAVLGWALLGRRGIALRTAAVPRGNADSTYFVAVFVWAGQTVVRAYESLHWGHFSSGPVTPWKFQALLAGAGTLLALLCISLMSEAVARRGGRPTRADGASIPLPVAAAIASGFGVWLVVMAPFAWR